MVPGSRGGAGGGGGAAQALSLAQAQRRPGRAAGGGWRRVGPAGGCRGQDLSARS